MGASSPNIKVDVRKGEGRGTGEELSVYKIFLATRRRGGGEVLPFSYFNLCKEGGGGGKKVQLELAVIFPPPT